MNSDLKTPLSLCARFAFEPTIATLRQASDAVASENDAEAANLLTYFLADAHDFHHSAESAEILYALRAIAQAIRSPEEFRGAQKAKYRHIVEVIASRDERGPFEVAEIVLVAMDHSQAFSSESWKGDFIHSFVPRCLPESAWQDWPQGCTYVTSALVSSGRLKIVDFASAFASRHKFLASISDTELGYAGRDFHEQLAQAHEDCLKNDSQQNDGDPCWHLEWIGYLNEGIYDHELDSWLIKPALTRANEAYDAAIKLRRELGSDATYALRQKLNVARKCFEQDLTDPNARKMIAAAYDLFLNGSMNEDELTLQLNECASSLFAQEAESDRDPSAPTRTYSQLPVQPGAGMVHVVWPDVVRLGESYQVAIYKQPAEIAAESTDVTVFVDMGADAGVARPSVKLTAESPLQVLHLVPKTGESRTTLRFFTATGGFATVILAPEYAESVGSGQVNTAPILTGFEEFPALHIFAQSDDQERLQIWIMSDPLEIAPERVAGSFTLSSAREELRQKFEMASPFSGNAQFLEIGNDTFSALPSLLRKSLERAVLNRTPVLIHSEHLWIPWEMYPLMLEGKPAVLAEVTPVIRVPARTTLPAIFDRKQVRFALSTRTPGKFRSRERAALHQFGGPDTDSIEYPCEPDGIITQMRDADRGIWYIGAHGEAAQERGSTQWTLQASDGSRITSGSLSAGQFGQIGAHGPLAIVNACGSVGRTGALLNEEDWSGLLMRVGASGYIGTQYTVSDEAAARFVELLATFSSTADQFLYELIYLVRRQMAAEYRNIDASWLAYIIVCHPSSMLVGSRIAEIT